jgi:hypothetical protein
MGAIAPVSVVLGPVMASLMILVSIVTINPIVVGVLDLLLDPVARLAAAPDGLDPRMMICALGSGM